MPVSVSLPNSNLKNEVSDFKRRRIREEASHLFFELGYEGTTLDAIAQRLEVTKPYLYTHYANKAELLHDICSTGIQESLKAIDGVLGDAGLSPGLGLERLVESVVGIILDFQEFIVVYVREEKNLQPEQARKIREQRSLFDHRLATLLEQGNRAGEFVVSEPALTANTIGGIMTWVALWYRPEGKWSRHQIIEHTLRTVLALVQTGQATGESIGPRARQLGMS